MGTIGTWQKCLKCKKRFSAESGFLCHGYKADNYFIQVYWKGRKHRIYSQRDGTSIDSLERAVRTLERISGEIEAERFDPANYSRKRKAEHSATQYFFRWLNLLEAKVPSGDISPRYLKQQTYIVQTYLISRLGHMDIREIRTRHVANFRLQLPSRLSPKTRKEIMDCLARILRRAHYEEIIDTIPQFEPIPQSMSHPLWIDRETQDKILEAIEPWHRPIFLFMCRQGVRPSEARALQVQDLNLYEGTVTIRRSFGSKGSDIIKETKTRRQREIPLEDAVWEMLKEHCKDILPKAWVFTCQNRRQGKPYGTSHPYSHTGLQEIWNRVCKAVNIRINIYQATRHSVASQAINEGISERLVGDFLGHSDSRVTRKYAHTNIETLRCVPNRKAKIIPFVTQKRRAG